MFKLNSKVAALKETIDYLEQILEAAIENGDGREIDIIYDELQGLKEELANC